MFVGRGGLERELDEFARMLEVAPPDPIAVAWALHAASDAPFTWPKGAIRLLPLAFGWAEIAADVDEELREIARSPARPKGVIPDA